MKIDLIAGARPNFMKIAPIIDAILKLKDASISYRLIHTGQHYDHAMSGSFFEELGIPNPHINLEVGGGTHAEQTALIMQRYESILLAQTTDICLVVGDVTSTMACAITAKKLNIPVAHVEGGIRSGDRTMPEEINRLVTDAISDVFFTTTQKANNNLLKEGHSENSLYLVGNTMIDTLLKQMPNFKKPGSYETLGLKHGKYLILTLHRPGNVDNPVKLQAYFDKITEGADGIAVVFPVHPRTRNVITEYKINSKAIFLIDPLSYLEFNYLVKNAMGVITDSGGITEETTVMHIPCITLRNSTERPETCEIGTNELIGTNPDNIPHYLHKLRNGDWKKGSIPDFWDGHAAERIVKILTTDINKKIQSWVPKK